MLISIFFFPLCWFFLSLTGFGRFRPGKMKKKFFFEIERGRGRGGGFGLGLIMDWDKFLWMRWCLLFFFFWKKCGRVNHGADSTSQTFSRRFSSQGLLCVLEWNNLPFTDFLPKQGIAIKEVQESSLERARGVNGRTFLCEGDRRTDVIIRQFESGWERMGRELGTGESKMDESRSGAWCLSCRIKFWGSRWNIKIWKKDSEKFWNTACPMSQYVGSKAKNISLTGTD